MVFDTALLLDLPSSSSSVPRDWRCFAIPSSLVPSGCCPHVALGIARVSRNLPRPTARVASLATFPIRWLLSALANSPPPNELSTSPSLIKALGPVERSVNSNGNKKPHKAKMLILARRYQ